MIMDDEHLSAYLDGELSPAELQAIDDALARDPELARRLSRLAESNAQAIAAFAEIDSQPLPATVEAMLQPVAGAKVIPLSSRRPAAPAWLGAWRPAAVAAGLAGLIGVGAGTLLRPAADPMTLALQGRGPVPAMLERVAGGTEVGLNSATKGHVQLTFAAADGAMCREFQVTSRARTASAVACRDATARWEIRLVAMRPQHRQGGGYATATADDDESFGRAVDAMIAQDPLDGDEEARLIARGWRGEK